MINDSISQYLQQKRLMADKQVGEIINEELLKFGQKIAVDYTKAYVKDGQAFINTFIKFKSVRMASAVALGYCNRNGIIEQGLKEQCEVLAISDYVNRLNLPDLDARLLKRTLTMIFILSR